MCGVPQGSVSGPILFALYTADVIRIAQSIGVQVHCYADGIHLYIHFRANEANAALARMLDCISAIYAWMGSNRFKMNSDKTKMIWLGTCQQLASLYVTLIRLHDGTTVVQSTSVHNLGVLFNNEMSMMAHVNSIASSCFFHLRQLLFIRRSLTPDAARIFVHAFIPIRVDYSNALMYGATSHVLSRLQTVLNAAA